MPLYAVYVAPEWGPITAVISEITECYSTLHCLIVSKYEKIVSFNNYTCYDILHGRGDATVVKASGWGNNI